MRHAGNINLESRYNSAGPPKLPDPMRSTPIRPGARSRIPALVLAAAVAAAGAGCSTYEARPLDGASVDRALGQPAMDSVRVEAARIRHPLVAPMVIDGRG